MDENEKNKLISSVTRIVFEIKLDAGKEKNICLHSTIKFRRINFFSIKIEIKKWNEILRNSNATIQNIAALEMGSKLKGSKNVHLSTL